MTSQVQSGGEVGQAKDVEEPPEKEQEEPPEAMVNLRVASKTGLERLRRKRRQEDEDKVRARRQEEEKLIAVKKLEDERLPTRMQEEDTTVKKQDEQSKVTWRQEEDRAVSLKLVTRRQEEDRSSVEEEQKREAVEEEKQKKDLTTPAMTITSGGKVRRSPGSKKKWLDRLLQYQGRMVRKKGGHMKLPQTKQRNRVRRYLTVDFGEERAEFRPLPSESVVGLPWDEWRRRSGEGVLIGGSLESASGAKTPPLPLAVSAGDIKINFMLRQSRVGESDDASSSCGQEMWWDQWLGWGWAGPYSAVYFCLGCQLKGGEGNSMAA